MSSRYRLHIVAIGVGIAILILGAVIAWNWFRPAEPLSLQAQVEAGFYDYFAKKRPECSLERLAAIKAAPDREDARKECNRKAEDDETQYRAILQVADELRLSHTETQIGLAQAIFTVLTLLATAWAAWVLTRLCDWRPGEVGGLYHYALAVRCRYQETATGTSRQTSQIHILNRDASGKVWMGKEIYNASAN